jgi:hypothetical protein
MTQAKTSLILRGRPLTSEEREEFHRQWDRKKAYQEIRKQFDEFVDSPEKEWTVDFPEQLMSAWRVYYCLYWHIRDMGLKGKIRINVVRSRVVLVHKL